MPLIAGRVDNGIDAGHGQRFTPVGEHFAVRVFVGCVDPVLAILQTPAVHVTDGYNANLWIAEQGRHVDVHRLTSNPNHGDGDLLGRRVLAQESGRNDQRRYTGSQHLAQ